MTEPLKTRQICFFFVALLPVAKFFTAPSVTCGVCGEDLWISALLNGLADILTVGALYFLLRDENCDFFTLVENFFGKAVAKTVAVFYIVFFLIKTVLPMNEVKNYVELTLYITSPNIMTFMPVFIAVFYIAVKRLRVVGRISDGILPIAVAGYFFTFLLSVSDADFGAILPVGARGTYSILDGAYSSSVWFTDGAYFLFFVGNYVKGKRDGLKILLAAALSSLIVVAFFIVFYGTFTSIAQRQRFALTEISKYTTAINNMERFDYIPVFALLFTAIFSLSLPFYFAAELVTRLLPVNRVVAATAVCAPSVILLLFFENYFAGIESFTVNLAGGYLLFFGCAFPIAVAILIKLRKKEKKSEIYRR